MLNVLNACLMRFNAYKYFFKVGEAMQKMHDRKNIGKIVLDPSLEPKPKPATPVKGKSKNADKEKEKKEEDSANGATTPEASSPTSMLLWFTLYLS